MSWRALAKKCFLFTDGAVRGSQLSSIATECNKKGFFVVSFDAPAHGGLLHIRLMCRSLLKQ